MMTDNELYSICKTYGERARLWRQKFAGLLPEVERRQLYKKKGFGSIFEFAAKLAGMSEEQVKLALSLGKKFEATPMLKSLLENGEVSIHKLARVASIDSRENEEFLERRELRLVQEKEKLASTMEPTHSRYIPVKVRKNLQEEYGEKCSISTCIKRAETIHHTQRFALSKTHDPKFLAPLCKEHRLIAHSIDLKFHEARKSRP